MGGKFPPFFGRPPDFPDGTQQLRKVKKTRDTSAGLQPSKIGPPSTDDPVVRFSQPPQIMSAGPRALPGEPRPPVDEPASTFKWFGGEVAERERRAFSGRETDPGPSIPSTQSPVKQQDWQGAQRRSPQLHPHSGPIPSPANERSLPSIPSAISTHHAPPQHIAQRDMQVANRLIRVGGGFQIMSTLANISDIPNMPQVRGAQPNFVGPTGHFALQPVKAQYPGVHIKAYPSDASQRSSPSKRAKDPKGAAKKPEGSEGDKKPDEEEEEIEFVFRDKEDPDKAKEPPSIQLTLDIDDNGQLVSIDLQDESKTQHLRNVEKRMRALPKIFCNSASGEIMELKMRRWASMAERDQQILDEANRKLRLLLGDDGKAKKRREERRGSIDEEDLFEDPLGSSKDHKHHGIPRLGYDGIQKYLEAIDPDEDDHEEVVVNTDDDIKTMLRNLPNIFDGKPLPELVSQSKILEELQFVPDRHLHGVQRNRVEPGTGAGYYEQACKDLNVVPATRVYSQMGEEDAVFANLGLGQRGGICLAAMLPHNTIVKTLNLSSNLLDEVALEAILNTLPMNNTIMELNLSYNIIRPTTCHHLAQLLDLRKPPMSGLTSLVLNNCNLGNEAAIDIARALEGGKNKQLENLNMGGNHIGDPGAIAIGTMLSTNETLVRLDLSWNNFKSNGAYGIAQGMRDNKTVEYLNISWNGLEDEGGKYLGDMLKVNGSLTELDLSHTRMGPEACMVLSEGIIMNESLEALHLAYNPCGEDGGRHLMVMLQENDVLERLSLEGCSFISRTIAGKTAAEFNKHDADGPYSLDMSSITDRSIIAFLLLLEGLQPGSVCNVRLDGKKLKDDGGYPPDLNWPVNLPQRGQLTLTFAGKTHGKPSKPKAIDIEDLENMCEQLSSNKISDRDRLTMLEMFSSSYYFYSENASRMLETFNPGKEKMQAAVILYFRVLDAENSHCLLPEVHELQRLRKMLGSHAVFRAANPTGHYELDLAVQADRMVASKLLESALYEGGARSWRNIKYDKKKVITAMGGPSEWLRGVPNTGLVVMDYTSSVLPEAQDTPLTDVEYRDFVLDVVANDSGRITGVGSICRLRESSVNVFMTAKQACHLINAFTEHDDRVEAAIILRSRVVDQEQLWTLFYTLASLEQMVFGLRIGWPVILNLRFPTGKYIIDMSDSEHREVARLLTMAAVRDQTKTNWHNLYVNGRRVSQPAENSSMWSVLTMDSVDPKMEFDFVGNDIWQLMGITSPSDRRARDVVLGRYAMRRNFKRLLFLHPYWVQTMNPGVTKGRRRWQKAGATGIAARLKQENPNAALDDVKDKAKLVAASAVAALDFHRHKLDTYNEADKKKIAVMQKMASKKKGDEEEEKKADAPAGKKVEIDSIDEESAEDKQERARRKSLLTLSAKDTAKAQIFRKQTAFWKTSTDDHNEGRIYGWQKGWDDFMKAVVVEEARHLDVEHGKCPLMLLFETFDEHRNGGITLPEFVNGLKEQCGYTNEVVSEDSLGKMYRAGKSQGGLMEYPDFEHLCMTRLAHIPDFPNWKW